jgi:hypothetical protein
VSLSHASCNVADMKAGDDEETSVKLVQTVEKFVYLYDFSHKYYVNNKKDATWREVSKEMDIITYLMDTQLISLRIILSVFNIANTLDGCVLT